MIYKYTKRFQQGNTTYVFVSACIIMYSINSVVFTVNYSNL